MYPLNMKTDGDQPGHAVANDEAEHQSLSALGYEPKHVASETEADPAKTDGEGHTMESVRAQLDAAGIPYDGRLGLAKLLALLPA